MKNLNITVAIIGISAVFMSCAGFIVPLQGNGNIVTSQRTISSFKKIHVSGSADVRFYASEEYRLEVSVDSNLEEYTDIFRQGNVLNIGTKKGNYHFTKYAVDVYCPELTGISISGSGIFSSNDTIAAPRLDMDVSGSGEINGTVKCDDVYAEISGSGSIETEGNTNNTIIDISGSGRFNGNSFNTNAADVRISGSGKVSVSVTNNLKARISGSGELRYRGTPQVDSSISGSGRVYPIN